MGFILRWVFAFLLLAATFNPTEYNYVDWVRSYGNANLSIAVLAGLILGIGYIIYLRALVKYNVLNPRLDCTSPRIYLLLDILFCLVDISLSE